MKSNLSLLLLLIISFSAQGQINNSVFEQWTTFQPADSNSLFFGLRTLGFTKNNEYFNDIADGYTLFGYQLNPYLSYYPTSNFRIEAGIYLQKDFGADGYAHIVPTFSFKYTHGTAAIIFGDLEGGVSHRLIEPLYDFERELLDTPETGIQLVVTKRDLFFDGWINWQNMIYRGDPEQERVTGGLSMDYRLFNSNTMELSLPVQFLVMHKGGQIDSDPSPLTTITNTATGFKLRYSMGAGSFVESVGMQNYYIYYKDFSGVSTQTFRDGTGWYLNAEVRTRHQLEMMVSYWHGHEFMSIMGGQLYPSVSSTFKKPWVVEPKRELLILRLMHNLKITDQLYLSTRVEPFYDLINNSFEFSHGFYINYSGDFFLLKKRAHR